MHRCKGFTDLARGQYQGQYEDVPMDKGFY
jgi:hypothetical protein